MFIAFYIIRVVFSSSNHKLKSIMFLRLHRRPLYIYFIDGSDDERHESDQGKCKRALRANRHVIFFSEPRR